MVSTYYGIGIPEELKANIFLNPWLFKAGAKYWDYFSEIYYFIITFLLILITVAGHILPQYNSNTHVASNAMTHKAIILA